MKFWIPFGLYGAYGLYIALTMPADPATWLSITIVLGILLLVWSIRTLVPKRS